MNIQNCIVCGSNLVESFQTSDSLNYWHCNLCSAKFLDKKHHIDQDSEKKRYLEHENIIEDKGYRNFLSKLSSPLMDKINTNAKGLDFGCGHGPALADIFIKNKYSIRAGNRCRKSARHASFARQQSGPMPCNYLWLISSDDSS